MSGFIGYSLPLIIICLIYSKVVNAKGTCGDSNIRINIRIKYIIHGLI